MFGLLSKLRLVITCPSPKVLATTQGDFSFLFYHTLKSMLSKLPLSGVTSLETRMSFATETVHETSSGANASNRRTCQTDVCSFRSQLGTSHHCKMPHHYGQPVPLEHLGTVLLVILAMPAVWCSSSSLLLLFIHLSYSQGLPPQPRLRLRITSLLLSCFLPCLPFDQNRI